MKAHRLASNENPFGAGRDAQAAIQAVPLGIYPDAAMHGLRARLAEHHRVSAGQVCIGAGSTDLIFQLVAALAGGGEVLAPRHSFVAYRLAAQGTGATYVETGTGVTTDLDALAARASPSIRLVCVVNPANPTGAFLEEEKLVAFLRQLPPGLPVILDEAYAEYVQPPRACTGTELLARFPNLIVLRTFSKAYGLAGLRVGYALGAPEWFARIDARRPPFSVSAHAQAAAIAALLDQEHMLSSVAATRIERERLRGELLAQGLEVLPSEANFLCVRVGDPAAAAQALLRHGLEVMPLQPYGLTEWLRVTVGLPEQNELFVAALSAFRRAA